MTGKKTGGVMEEIGNAWSALGSEMNLPSVLRQEIELLKLSLRDLTLKYQSDIAMLREEVSSLREKAKSSYESIEERLDEFNVYSFLSPEEVGIVPEDTVEMEVVESIHVKGNVAPPPVVATGEWWEENSAEDLGVLAFDKLLLLIEEKGGVLNNRIWSELCPRSFKADKVAKKVLKEAIADSDDIESVKVDKIRSFLYKSGGNANELYKQVYGKALDS